MWRTEGYNEGSTPLQTIRADIEYGFAEAKTTYGRIGIKVWIYALAGGFFTAQPPSRLSLVCDHI